MMYTSNELSHHGIKGQKWGVRRYQNEDGSLTDAGRKRYGVGDRIVNSTAKRYQQYGLSEEEAREAAQKRAELLKKVAIAAGVSVGVAATVYFAREYGRNYVDTVIKAGTTIQTLSAHADRMQTGKAFYTSHRSFDKLKYEAMFGEETGTFGYGTGQFKNKIVANVGKDIKIASTKNATKVFKELLNNDPNFVKQFNTAKLNTNFDAMRKLYPQFKNATDYEMFNTFVLLDNDSSYDSVKDTFYSSLKQLGYGGVHDVNDRKFSGFKTAADIVFDRSGISVNTPVSRLTGEEVKNAKVATKLLKLGEAIIKPTNVAAGSAYVGALTMANYDAKIRRKTKEKKNSNRKGG